MVLRENPSNCGVGAQGEQLKGPCGGSHAPDPGDLGSGGGKPAGGVSPGCSRSDRWSYQAARRSAPTFSGVKKVTVSCADDEEENGTDPREGEGVEQAGSGPSCCSTQPSAEQIPLEALLGDDSWHRIELIGQDDTRTAFRAAVRHPHPAHRHRSVSLPDPPLDPTTCLVKPSHVRRMSRAYTGSACPSLEGSLVLVDRGWEEGSLHGLTDGEVIERREARGEGAGVGFFSEEFKVLYMHGKACGREEWISATRVFEIDPNPHLNIATLRRLAASPRSQHDSPTTRKEVGPTCPPVLVGFSKGSEGGGGGWSALEKAEKEECKLRPTRNHLPLFLSDVPASTADEAAPTSSKVRAATVRGTFRRSKPGVWWPKSLDPFVPRVAADSLSTKAAKRRREVAGPDGCPSFDVVKQTMEVTGDEASLDGMQVYCFGSGANADRRSEGAIEIVNGRIRIRCEMGLMSLNLFTNDFCRNRNKSSRKVVFVSDLNVTLHDYLSDPRPTASASLTAQGAMRGCGKKAKSVVAGGGPRPVDGRKAGGEGGLDKTAVSGEDGGSEAMASMCGGEEALSHTSDDHDDGDCEEDQEEGRLAVPGGRGACPRGTDGEQGRAARKGVGGKSLNRVRIGKREREAADDGDSSGWDESDGRVRVLMTTGCRALMVLADVMHPWAFKDNSHQSTQWRENLPSCTLGELAHRIRLFEASIKPSVFSKFYQRDVKRTLLHLLDALKCDSDAEAAVHCLALHVCPAAFMHMPLLPWYGDGDDGSCSGGDAADFGESDGCESDLIDEEGGRMGLSGEAAGPADVIPETPSPVQREKAAAWRNSVQGGAVLR